MAAIQRVVHFLEYLLCRFLEWMVGLLSFRFALSLAQPIGLFLYLILRRQRQMALENLRQAFQSEQSEPEIRQLARRAFVDLAEFGIEWFRMPRIAKNSGRYLVSVNQGERIQAELKKGKGAIVLICHAGNWEIMALMGLLVAKPVGASLYAVARPLKNPYLYHHAICLRGLMGLRTIDKSGGVEETFARLKENSIVCILVDQRVSEGSVEVNFFGRPALTTSLPVVAALRLGTPIFFNFLHRTSDLRYVMDVEGPIPLEHTGNVHRDILTNTQRFMARIEAEIRKDLPRWLWMHNRWRIPHGPKD